MSSSVHFKFKSQKEPSRVTFDGTGISVFELKREIISINRLGDGTDFELSIYNEDTNEEYEDDTTIIPRSTSVIARRLPAARAGRGGAARYVSGKAPVNARNASRIESASARGGRQSNNISRGAVEFNETQSEEDRIRAILSLESSQWSQQQQEMANAVPVPYGRGRPKASAPTGPDRPLPPGYLCYRCREKGHWIHNCPTNNDPNFDGRVRVKRTTGIPRSQLKTVEKPDLLASETSGGDSKASGIMVNAEGDFVIAQPDKATWELYSEKLKETSAAEKRAEASGSYELQARGLKCPIDQRMFVEPMKTPCCGKTYCNDCISNALIESDFVCPSCATTGVLLDNLTPDDDMGTRLKSYEEEKIIEQKQKSRGKERNRQDGEDVKIAESATGDSQDLREAEFESNAIEDNKHHLADEIQPRPKADEPTRAAKKPKLNETQSLDPINNTRPPQQAPQPKESLFNNNMQFNSHMPYNQMTQSETESVPGMGFPPGFPAMPLDLMMLQPTGFANTNPGWMPMPGMAFGNMFPNNSFPNAMMHDLRFTQAASTSIGFNNFPTDQGPTLQLNNGMHSSFNQAQQMYNSQFQAGENNAYMRLPVNPQRNQARQKRARPHDYREL